MMSFEPTITQPYFHELSHLNRDYPDFPKIIEEIEYEDPHFNFDANIEAWWQELVVPSGYTSWKSIWNLGKKKNKDTSKKAGVFAKYLVVHEDYGAEEYGGKTDLFNALNDVNDNAIKQIFRDTYGQDFATLSPTEQADALTEMKNNLNSSGGLMKEDKYFIADQSSKKWKKELTSRGLLDPTELHIALTQTTKQINKIVTQINIVDQHMDNTTDRTEVRNLTLKRNDLVNKWNELQLKHKDLLRQKTLDMISDDIPPFPLDENEDEDELGISLDEDQIEEIKRAQKKEKKKKKKEKVISEDSASEFSLSEEESNMNTIDEIADALKDILQNEETRLKDTQENLQAIENAMDQPQSSNAINELATLKITHQEQITKYTQEIENLKNELEAIKKLKSEKELVYVNEPNIEENLADIKRKYIQSSYDNSKLSQRMLEFTSAMIMQWKKGETLPAFPTLSGLEKIQRPSGRLADEVKDIMTKASTSGYKFNLNKILNMTWIDIQKEINNFYKEYTENMGNIPTKTLGKQNLASDAVKLFQLKTKKKENEQEQARENEIKQIMSDMIITYTDKLEDGTELTHSKKFGEFLGELSSSEEQLKKLESAGQTIDPKELNALVEKEMKDPANEIPTNAMLQQIHRKRIEKEVKAKLLEQATNSSDLKDRITYLEKRINNLRGQKKIFETEKRKEATKIITNNESSNQIKLMTLKVRQAVEDSDSENTTDSEWDDDPENPKTEEQKKLEREQKKKEREQRKLKKQEEKDLRQKEIQKREEMKKREAEMLALKKEAEEKQKKQAEQKAKREAEASQKRAEADAKKKILKEEFDKLNKEKYNLKLTDFDKWFQDLEKSAQVISRAYNKWRSRRSMKELHEKMLKMGAEAKLKKRTDASNIIKNAFRIYKTKKPKNITKITQSVNNLIPNLDTNLDTNLPTSQKKQVEPEQKTRSQLLDEEYEKVYSELGTILDNAPIDDREKLKFENINSKLKGLEQRKLFNQQLKMYLDEAMNIDSEEEIDISVNDFLKKSGMGTRITHKKIHGEKGHSAKWKEQFNALSKANHTAKGLSSNIQKLFDSYRDDIETTDKIIKAINDLHKERVTKKGRGDKITITTIRNRAGIRK